MTILGPQRKKSVKMRIKKGATFLQYLDQWNVKALKNIFSLVLISSEAALRR